METTFSERNIGQELIDNYNKQMRVAVIGTAGQGKSTLVRDLVEEFPNYKTPVKTYRDIIDKEGLKHSSSGDQSSQKKILDFLVNQLMTNTDDMVIYDRCPIDALMYTMYIADHNKNIDSDFIQYCIKMVRETMQFLDLIIYVPYDSSIPIVEDKLRDTSEGCIKSVGNLFEAFYESYLNNIDQAPWFPTFEEGGTPLILPVRGSREDRIKQIKDLLNSEGKFIEPSEDGIGSIISDYADMSNLEDADNLIAAQHEIIEEGKKSAEQSKIVQ